MIVNRRLSILIQDVLEVWFENKGIKLTNSTIRKITSELLECANAGCEDGKLTITSAVVGKGFGINDRRIDVNIDYLTFEMEEQWSKPFRSWSLNTYNTLEELENAVSSFDALNGNGVNRSIVVLTNGMLQEFECMSMPYFGMLGRSNVVWKCMRPYVVRYTTPVTGSLPLERRYRGKSELENELLELLTTNPNIVITNVVNIYDNISYPFVMMGCKYEFLCDEEIPLICGQNNNSILWLKPCINEPIF